MFKDRMLNYINSGYPLVLITTSEEGGQSLQKICQENTKKPDMEYWEWSLTTGWLCANEGVTQYKELKSPKDALQAIVDGRMNDNSLVAIRGFDSFFPPPEAIQMIKDLVDICKARGQMIVFISHTNPIPPALTSHITMVDFVLPTEEELHSVLTGVIEDAERTGSVTDEIINQAVESALGMTEFEAENAFALSFSESQTITPEIIRREKAQVIKKSGLLEYYEPNNSMVDVGGLDLLKDWSKVKGKAYTHSIEAKAFGLPALSGIINVGVAGCGKSLFAKAIAKEWNLSLLRFDVSKIFGSLVGKSEQNMRESLALAEAMSPCILWIDEIEKALAGAGNSGTTDNGITARVLGVLLTWMQEKEKPVFVVATANDVTGLRPELLSRFNEIFAVDLPNERERKEILEIHITKQGRKVKNFNLPELTKLSDGFSGREIEQSIISGLYEAFDELTEKKAKDLETRHIIKAMNETKPLAETMPEQTAKIREWCSTYARPSTSDKSTAKPKSAKRKIIVDAGSGGVA